MQRVCFSPNYYSENYLLMQLSTSIYILGVKNVLNILRGGSTDQKNKISPINKGPEMHTFRVLYTCS